MQGGVYSLHVPQYRERFPQHKVLKIGHSRDIVRRFQSADTFALPEDSLLHAIEQVVHSPSNAASGTRILESLIHSFYRDRRITADREFFKFDPGFRLGPEVLDHLRSKNITDAALYDRLADVPVTEVDPDYLRNHNDLLGDPDDSEKVDRAPSPLAPRACQVPILKRLLEHFETHDKGGLYLPPGLGKTFLAGFFLQQQPHWNRVLVLTPQIMIGDEFRKMFQQVGTGSRALHVVSSEDEDIGVLKPLLDRTDRYVLITTYQTYCQKATLFRNSYDFIVYDEAHHLATSTTFQAALALTGRKLFLTATPKIVHADEDTDEVVTYSLDNENVYGPSIYELTMLDAIRQGMLTDFRILLYEEEGVTQAEEPSPEEERMEEEEEEKTDEDEEDDNDASEPNSVEAKVVSDPVNCEPHIRMLTHQYGRRRVLVFYNTCRDAQAAHENLCRSMPAVGSFYVDGAMSKVQRQDIFRQFEAEDQRPKVLFNVNVVAEGVSLPCVDGVLLMATKTSAIVLSQIIGRALRLYPGKTEAIVCVPIRSDLTQKVLLETVWADAEKSRTPGSAALASRLMVETKNLSEMLKIWEFNLKIIEVSKSGGLWEYRFQQCQAWEKDNPNRKIPSRLNFNGNGGLIGHWLGIQRRKLKKGLTTVDQTSLSVEQQNKLRTLFSWRTYIDINRTPWMVMFNECKDWEQQHHDQLIDQKIWHHGKHIGKWLSSQRSAFKKFQIIQNPQAHENDRKRISKMTYGGYSKERDAHLSTLRSWKDKPFHPRYHQPWETSLKLCQNWERLNQKKCINQKTTYNGHNIGSWLTNQKSALKAFRHISEQQNPTKKQCAKAGKFSYERHVQLEVLYTWREWMKTCDVQDVPTTLKRVYFELTDQVNKRQR